MLTVSRQINNERKCIKYRLAPREPSRKQRWVENTKAIQHLLTQPLLMRINFPHKTCQQQSVKPSVNDTKQTSPIIYGAQDTNLSPPAAETRDTHSTMEHGGMGQGHHLCLLYTQWCCGFTGCFVSEPFHSPTHPVLVNEAIYECLSCRSPLQPHGLNFILPFKY